MKYNKYLLGCILAISICFLTSCSGRNQEEEQKATIAETGQSREGTVVIIDDKQENELQDETVIDTEAAEPEAMEPVVTEVDWSDYFGKLNGAAVVYDAERKQYLVYHQELARERRSPCSTFKIISSLIGLENGIIKPRNSVHTWSGERFWNEAWNQDIGFEDAFRSSCVWYYREIVNEIGPELMQDELKRLQYGNMDISDWEGRLNNNNNNRALTGFWIESSLKISPMEQVQVMEQIFGDHIYYKKDSIEALKQVMMVTDYDTEKLIYGKTGMGKVSGVVVDSWFTGFMEHGDRNIYFCVYLGETQGAEVSSAKAKEIAVRIMTDTQF